MAKPKVNKIVSMQIEEVSAVDKAANGRKFLIIKNANEEVKDGGTALDKVVSLLKNTFGWSDIDKTTFSEVFQGNKARDELWLAINSFHETVRRINKEVENQKDRVQALKVSAEQFATTMGELAPKLAKNEKGGGEMTLEDVLKSLDEDKAKLIQDELAKMQEEIDNLKKSEPADGDSDDDIMKGLPDELRKRFEEMEKRAKDAEEIAKAEREARLDAEFRKRAEGYANVGAVDAVADTLRKAYNISDEYGKQVEELMKAAHARIEEGKLFVEAGGFGGAYATMEAEGKINKLADELVAKDPQLTKADAIIKVAESNPQLYAEYLDEQRNRK